VEAAVRVLRVRLGIRGGAIVLDAGDRSERVTAAHGAEVQTRATAGDTAKATVNAQPRRRHAAPTSAASVAAANLALAAAIAPVRTNANCASYFAWSRAALAMMRLVSSSMVAAATPRCEVARSVKPTPSKRQWRRRASPAPMQRLHLREMCEFPQCAIPCEAFRCCATGQCGQLLCQRGQLNCGENGRPLCYSLLITPLLVFLYADERVWTVGFKDWQTDAELTGIGNYLIIWQKKSRKRENYT
jgi:hypothetical protein